MKSPVLHTVWRNIAGEAAGEIWNWSLLGMKGLTNTLIIYSMTFTTEQQTLEQPWNPRFSGKIIAYRRRKLKLWSRKMNFQSHWSEFATLAYLWEWLTLNDLTSYYTGTCQDSDAQCATWASSGECQKNPGWMLKNCRRSCHQCPTTGESSFVFARTVTCTRKEQTHRVKPSSLSSSKSIVSQSFNPFTPKSDQCQISPPASPEIWHHTQYGELGFA